MKSKSPSWHGRATVRPRRQGRRGVAFIGAKRKPLTEGADGSGAEFGQEGQESGDIPIWFRKIESIGGFGVCEAVLEWLF